MNFNFFCAVRSSQKKMKKAEKEMLFCAEMLFLVLKKRQLKRRVGCDDDCDKRNRKNEFSIFARKFFLMRHFALQKREIRKEMNKDI
jgi:hypothetical protein